MSKKVTVNPPDLRPLVLPSDEDLGRRIQYLKAIQARLGSELSPQTESSLFLPYLFVGIRTLSATSDALEWYTYKNSLRHSLCVIDFPNGKARAIFHVVAKPLLPPEILPWLPDVLNAAIVTPLFPRHRFAGLDKYIVLYSGEHWIPTKLVGVRSPQHHLLLEPAPVVDDPSVSPLTGSSVNVRHRWNTRYVALQPPQQQIAPPRVISPLATRQVSISKRSLEASFDPDKEIEGELL